MCCVASNKMRVDAVLILVISIVGFSNAYKLTIGQCMIYYEEPCQLELVRFYLYTMSSITPSTYKIILDPFEPVLPINFNFSAPIKIIVHGYAGSEDAPTINSIPKMYTSIGYQSIMVDWSPLAKSPCYPAAFLNTWHVGQCIAILATSLLSYGVKPNQLHALGFSLGAHIASFASNHLQKSSGLPFGRITVLGLDPALPFFASHLNDWKLDPSDADFVDIIHTNAGSFGKIESLGHVDFYVNGGNTQPICGNNIYTSYCSHLMVNLYYAESITSKKFIGIECPSVFEFLVGNCKGAKKNFAVMGEHCDSRTRGVYFLNTAISPPFGLG